MKNQKIIPSLWFDKNCEEAFNLYINTFNQVFGNKDSKIISIERYPEGKQVGPVEGMEGKVLTAIFDLVGYRFMALDGGPYFKFNPSISFFVHCKTKDQVNQLWEELSNDGKVRMPLDKYPFSEWYGWIEDKYGVNWQLILSVDEVEQKIVPSLLFVGEKVGKAEEAINFYVDIFKKSKINNIARYTEEQESEQEGTIAYAEFVLEGQKFTAMDSAREHEFDFNEAISFYVECEDQEEVDYFWEKLSAVAESEQCGWLKDKYGVSWQIVPKQLGELMSDPDKEKAGRVMDAMLKMKKIDVEGLKKAYEGK